MRRRNEEKQGGMTTRSRTGTKRRSMAGIKRWSRAGTKRRGKAGTKRRGGAGDDKSNPTPVNRGSTQQGTQQRRVEPRKRVDWEEGEGESRRGGGRGSMRSRVDDSWLCSFLYFLNSIACIYVQIQGRLALPWENICILLESLCDEVRNEALNGYLR